MLADAQNTLTLIHPVQLLLIKLLLLRDSAPLARLPRDVEIWSIDALDLQLMADGLSWPGHRGGI